MTITGHNSDMNHWTQTHVWVGLVGMLVLDAMLLAFLTYKTKEIQKEEAGH